jgi:hypothetical protein
VIEGPEALRFALLRVKRRIGFLSQGDRDIGLGYVVFVSFRPKFPLGLPRILAQPIRGGLSTLVSQSFHVRRTNSGGYEIWFGVG